MGETAVVVETTARRVCEMVHRSNKCPCVVGVFGDIDKDALVVAVGRRGRRVVFTGRRGAQAATFTRAGVPSVRMFGLALEHMCELLAFDSELL